MITKRYCNNGNLSKQTTTKNFFENFCFKIISKNNLDNQSKVKKKAKHETLDEALFLWFCFERVHGLPVSGLIIQLKALSLNKQLPNGDPNFSASQGWLDR